ncbi:MAG TPA: efflux RND transporter periplasmic adaptor subunit, partial [Desulfobacteraceae bacterium]|nr:efflux RND transporter periplasmic adaptor subunit [Desulfobacteraceae bacterium]
FVVKDNLATKRAIRIGRQLGTMSEVLDGIDAGERIVISPPDKMADGIKVKISE